MILLRRKMMQESIGVEKYKFLLKGAKVALKANNIYNNLTNPVTFAQLAQEHFPNLVVCSMLSHSIIVSVLCDNHIDTDYETFSFVKDVSEGCFTVANNIANMKQNEKSRMILVYIRLCLLVYRVAEHFIAADMANPAVCVADYIHFLASLVC